MLRHRILLQVLVGKIMFTSLATWAVAADGFALLNRRHVGRVKTVSPSEGRLVVEGMFHDRSFREIQVTLESEASITNPDMMNRTRPATRGDIRPGDYVTLECVESGNRHAAREVTITSTEAEEKLQRGLLRRGRGTAPELRGTGGDPR